MTIALSPELREVMIRRHQPHCIGWVRASASLWGMADDHDLDEPVRLTEEAPVRMRYQAQNLSTRIITDRALSLKTIRCGHHVAMRLYLKNGKFFEVELSGLSQIGHDAEVVEVSAC
jgi:hypothetical protein